MLGDLAGGEPDRVRVERAGQGRSVVIRTIRRLPPSRSREQRVVLAAEHGREVGEDLVELLAVRAATASVASWARFSFDAATNCIARVICLMFFTEPIRRRILAGWPRVRAVPLGPRPRPGRSCGRSSIASSRAFAELVGQGLRLAELRRGSRAAPSRGTGRSAISNSLTRGVGTSSSLPFVAAYRIATCFSTGSGWYCGCLMISDSFSPRVSWSRVALSRSDANWAKAASARYWARSSLSGAGDLLHRLGLGGRADARDRDADVQRGPLAGVEQVGLEEDLAVGDRDDVGRDVGRHVAGLGLDDRQRRQRAAAVLVVQPRGALEQPAVEVEDVARVGLAAGRAAQQQRHLAVRPGVLAEVVVDAQGVLDQALGRHLDAVLHDLLAHRHARVRGEVLERGGILGAGDDDDRVLHRAVLLEHGHGLGDGRQLLADRHVDADEALALLVDDRVDRDRGLARLAVADDQLALATADRDQRVDRLDAGLDRGVDRLADDDAGGDALDRAGLRRHRSGPCRRAAGRAGRRPGRAAPGRPAPRRRGRWS